MVEGFTGADLEGWAIDPERGGRCGIRVLDETGATLAQGMADRPRPDLARYGFGRTDFAFRIAVPAAAVGRLRVLADGAELAGSPVRIGAGQFDGAIAVTEGCVEGWVQERRAAAPPPWVRVLDQHGRCLAGGAASQGERAGRFAPARFLLQLDAAAWDGCELELRADAEGAVFAATQARLTLRSSLDRLDGLGCSGWLMCPEAPRVRFEIDVFRDGVLIGRARADEARHDLRESFIEPSNVGFSFEAPDAAAAAARPRSWSLRLRGSSRELFDGPFVIGAARGHIAVGRRLARLALTHEGLDRAERTVLQAALAGYIGDCRNAAPGRLRQAVADAPAAGRRLSVVVPVYRDVELTRACIDSVLAQRCAETDAVVVVNDASPEPGMAELLELYAALPLVHVLTNAGNRGFVGAANRGLEFCRGGDVLLLNSDTTVFAGGIDGLWEAAHSGPDIGTATAMSNNATIFSYPVPDSGCAALPDIGWDEAAGIALAANAGRVIDVPTAHGFCMLIRRELLDRVGLFDDVFGRGYGEENELCLRAQDLGFRHVAAAAVLVEHRESVSFGEDKQALLRANLAVVEQRFPEYAADIRDFIRTDGLRSARWAIDRIRLERAAAGGTRFVLVLRNWLQGGTQKAIDDMAGAAEGGPTALDLFVSIDGTMRLACAAPLLTAVFAAAEHDAMWWMLERIGIEAVLIHQLLGFGAGFIAALRGWRTGLRRVYYLHDFYPLCPRVTMIDAAGEFCDVAPVTVCERCVAIGGAHEASRLTELGPAAHRALFADLLGGVDRVVAPSASAAGYLERGMPGLPVAVVPHAEPPGAYAAPRPDAIGPDIVLLGAMGPHKGSAKLLEIARRALLIAPELRFHVIGYTDIDAALLETGIVTISGAYRPAELPGLVAATGAAMALFLHRWPETFSYTLSEAVQLGLIPLVPDIGAPAERVRAAGYGVVFGFPIEPAGVLRVLADVIAGRIDAAPGGARPANFAWGAGRVPPGRAVP